jgi:hypothetical protein
MGEKQDKPLFIVTSHRDSEPSDKDTEEENHLKRQHQAKDSQLRTKTCQSLSVQIKEERRVSHKYKNTKIKK